MVYRLLVFLVCFFNLSSMELANEQKKIFERDLTMKDIHLDELYFPPDFLFGFAICEHQNSGSTNSNWSNWENTSYPSGQPHIRNGEKSTTSCDHWNHYQEDINNMATDFNVNAFRFSVAWDRVEPEEGVFSEEALDHYAQEIDALLTKNIIPMITLHHFVHPQWFEEKGAFEKEENIAYFVRFSKKIFERFADKVPYWCTINEPTIYMFQGYLPLNCAFPPGKGSPTSWPLAVKVLKNMLQAHTEVYHSFKKMDHGDKAQIGLVHQYLKFESYTPYNLTTAFPGMLVNGLMNDSVLNFLKTGTFSYGFPCYYHEEYTASTGPVADFVGLNYYSRALIGWSWSKLQPDGLCYPDETMTDMPYGIYPKGLYDAIKDLASTGLPIIITENGIADKKTVNDSKRVEWYKGYLKATSLALEDGFDVRGFFAWTLNDNFEWDMGYDMQFGLYSVDKATQKRTLKEGAYVYADTIKAARNGLLNNHTRDYQTMITPKDVPSSNLMKLVGVSAAFGILALYMNTKAQVNNSGA